VLNDVGHPRAREGVDQHQPGNDGERRADHAAGCFQQQDHPDDRSDEIDLRRLSRTRCQLAIEQEQVRTAECGDRSEDPVLQGDPIARRGLAEWIRQKAGKEREPEMQGAHLGIVEDEGVEGERQWRGVPELQQRPANADGGEQRAREPDGLAPAEVGLLDQLSDVEVLRHLSSFPRKREPSVVPFKRQDAGSPLSRG